MQESDPATPTFFLPILVLVIIQLGKVVREADLTTIVKEEHPPLLISPIISILFASIRWLIWGLWTTIIFKLISNSYEARLQSWFYEKLKPVLQRLTIYREKP